MYMARIGTRYSEMTAIKPDTGAVHSNMVSTQKFCGFTKGNVVKPKNLVLSNELVRVELSPRKILKLTFRRFERYLRFRKSTFH